MTNRAQESLLAEVHEFLHYRLTAQARIEELERALREARLQLKYLHDKFGVTGSGMGVIAHIDAALDQSPATSRAKPSR